jgi:NAD(P)-dependent dehydrogenase (short-subunit alcohol dehydrogenase family)
MFIDKTVEAFGQLDIVVLNAAISVSKYFVDSKPEDYVSHMHVNYLQAVYLAHYAYPHLKKTRGKLVGISSLSSTPRQRSYCADTNLRLVP